jgi:uncharacterized membrane-anchored protein
MQPKTSRIPSAATESVERRYRPAWRSCIAGVERRLDSRSRKIGAAAKPSILGRRHQYRKRLRRKLSAP